MLKNYRYLLLIAILFSLNSCKKKEYVDILQDKYEPKINEAESASEDFTVSLNASTLQSGERGEWRILAGNIVDNYVSLEDKNNPFSKFKGLPGEEYTLEWKRIDKDGSIGTVQVKIKIPLPAIEITDISSSKFETIRTLSVNPKYRGSWSIDGAYGQLSSKYFDGNAESPDKKPSIELHGYANTNYTATYNYTYAGKVFQYKKTFKTGNYTQDEGLYELQLSRGDGRIIEDNQGNILELNLQASGIAWIFGEPKTYPALSAFKYLRRLILGGSSLREISPIFGDHYLNLEELNIDGAGYNTNIPDNIGNLTKLKIFLFAPRNSAPSSNEVLLPKSFANLKALELFSVRYSGYVNFNGTLGGLTNLKKITTTIFSLTDDIGELKELEHVELNCKYAYFPQRFSECKSLKFLRLIFDDNANGEMTLSSKMGDLRNLETLEITSNKLRALPESFSALPTLKSLKISGLNLQSIPENFGNLQSLESLTLYGSFTKLPNSFGNLSKLSTLFLGGKAETLPESFGDLTSLTYFNGESSGIKSLPNSFGKLKKLKEINLQFSKVESLPTSFGELDALERLNLNSTQLKTFPKAIIPLKSINNISFNNTDIDDIPDDVAKMKQGIIFNLYSIPNLTLERLKYIISISKGKVYASNFGYFST
ncbi:leucine-rich repeat domain-containing protein [Pedobacter sp. GSP4]|uniref:leucine-rich repeat domain-containing protein n=1 Tax=Pedobacter sp. GSP4 TaxID=3453716 RepID=UPI003EEDD468